MTNACMIAYPLATLQAMRTWQLAQCSKAQSLQSPCCRSGPYFISGSSQMVQLVGPVTAGGTSHKAQLG